ncbi:MAG: hypothetical protein JNK72_07935 [Myxococcales bacterium]|nr:hypothetical protein [Myxococcales bacterium]
MKRLYSVFLALGVVFSLGCGDEGVGDPCAPQRPGNRPCDPASTNTATNGCFVGTEIYIETQSLQCRSRICVVYQYSEATDTAGRERPKRVYCTCRCGVPPSLQASTDSNVLCQCPENFSCVSIAGDQYPPGVQGSYCIRSTTVSR